MDISRDDEFFGRKWTIGALVDLLSAVVDKNQFEFKHLLVTCMHINVVYAVTSVFLSWRSVSLMDRVLSPAQIAPGVCRVHVILPAVLSRNERAVEYGRIGQKTCVSIDTHMALRLGFFKIMFPYFMSLKSAYISTINLGQGLGRNFA